ncbi:MAG: dihydroorotase [Deltaproteobacteria bacterium]|nr:MAG: dihydroorotase [Deltaproteobacteria bacterium]
MSQRTLTLLRPDDWHVHLRDGDALRDTVRDVSRQFARAIAMPNLVPPVRTAADVVAYRERILAARPAGSGFTPLMTIYLTDRTSPEDVAAARAAGAVAAKLYPAGATTHSDAGVTDLAALDATLDALAAHEMPLLVHGEVTAPEVDVFDREARFVAGVLAPLVARHGALRVVLEHVTTRVGVDFVTGARPGVAATITAHHLLYDRNALFAGGLRPHRYCLPLPKRSDDRRALVAAATSGDPRFFLGTDSAPHPRHRKEAACGAAGAYTAHAAIELYAEVFEAAGALDRLEGFASHHGPDFYRLPRNADPVTLVRDPWTVPETLPLGDGPLVPLRAGETLTWRLVR